MPLNCLSFLSVQNRGHFDLCGILYEIIVDKALHRMYRPFYVYQSVNSKLFCRAYSPKYNSKRDESNKKGNHHVFS